MNFIKNLYTVITELFKVQKKVETLPVVEVTVPDRVKPKRKYVRKNRNVTH